MKLPLAFFGDPLLRKKSEPVAEITDEIRKLADDMLETMYAHYGVGLSAIQVKVPLRICIICPDVVYRQDGYDPGTPQFFINPKLSEPARELEEREEGCLSIPRVYGGVIRPKAITVEAMNLEGETFSARLEGYPARVLMHENDHLNGVLFIDRMPDRERKAIDRELREIKKRYH